MLKTVGVPKMASPNKSLNSQAPHRPGFCSIETDACERIWGIKQLCASGCTLCTPVLVCLSGTTEVPQSQNGGGGGYLGEAGGVRAYLSTKQPCSQSSPDVRVDPGCLFVASDPTVAGRPDSPCDSYATFQNEFKKLPLT